MVDGQTEAFPLECHVGQERDGGPYIIETPLGVPGRIFARPTPQRVLIVRRGLRKPLRRRAVQFDILPPWRKEDVDVRMDARAITGHGLMDGPTVCKAAYGH